MPESEVHEPEPTPLEDKKWLAAHPRVLGAIIICKKLLMPILAVTLPLYFNYRIDRDKLRAEAGYGATAEAIKKLQEAVTTLQAQMQPTQQLALAQSVRSVPSVPSATVEANVALSQFKRDLVVKVQKSQGHVLLLRTLPEKLDDVPTKK